MQNLISNTNKTMRSIDLLEMINEARAALGESKVENRHLLARIDDELEGDLGDRKTFTHPQNHKQIGYYDLTVDQCMLVGMRESKAVRRSVLKKLKELQQFKIPQTLPEALQLAADLAKKIEEDKPKIEVYERLADRKGDVSTTVIAKQLGTTSIKLNRWLREIGAKWLNSDLPKAGFMDWFNVVSDVKNGHEFTQCLVTPHGQIEIAKRWEAK